MILITAPGKSILRTPKGSIQKKATIKAYEAEIDALYVFFLYHLLSELSHLKKGMMV